MRVRAKAGTFTVGKTAKHLPVLVSKVRTLTVKDPAAPSVSTTTPVRGTTVGVRGALAPATVRPVELQQQAIQGAPWVVVSSGKTNAKGSYSFTYRAQFFPYIYGKVGLRVVAKAGSFKVGHKTEKLPALTTLTRTITVVIGPPPSASERAALIDLYNATDGPRWSDAGRFGWNTDTNACSWGGVTCDDSGHVIEIALPGIDLSGSLPDSLSNLVYLQSLDLSYNGLSGSIPASLGSLASLSYLDLSDNGLSGQVPDSLTGLANLTNLLLEGNGCLTASSTTAAWLTGLDPSWSGGCTT